MVPQSTKTWLEWKTIIVSTAQPDSVDLAVIEATH